MTTARGRDGDGRHYDLPETWEPLDTDLLDVALERALAALAVTSDGAASALHRLGAYYDPRGRYAGNLFSVVEPNDAFSIGAADLWAVSTLSMEVPPQTGRRLLSPGQTRTEVVRHLRHLPLSSAIDMLDPPTLTTMARLYQCLRTVMATDDTSSNWWVFASKMCARKRPLLYPVRDKLVCSYLSGDTPLGRGPKRLGNFISDIQVFAFLMTSEAITRQLTALREQLAGTDVAAEVDWSDLRLLDITIWTAAKSRGN